jgi:hypothetical protein
VPPELNAIRPDGFEYCFVDEEFVADSLDLHPSNHTLVREIPSCLHFAKMCETSTLI